MLGMGRLWLLVPEGTFAILFGILIILAMSVTVLATYVFLISRWIRRAKEDRLNN